MRFSTGKAGSLVGEKTPLDFSNSLVLFVASYINFSHYVVESAHVTKRQRGKFVTIVSVPLVVFTGEVTVHLSISVQLIECQLPPKTKFSALAPAFI